MAINVNTGVTTTPTIKSDKVEQNVQKQQLAQQQAQLNAPVLRQDSVSLTSTVQQFAKATDKAASSTGIDQQKVDRIKQEIAEGKYKVNVEQLARRIIQFEGDLFAKK